MKKAEIINTIIIKGVNEWKSLKREIKIDVLTNSESSKLLDSRAVIRWNVMIELIEELGLTEEYYKVLSETE